MRIRCQVLALTVATVTAVSTPLLSRAQVLHNTPAATPVAQLATNPTSGGMLSTGSIGVVRILLLDFRSNSADIRFAPGMRILPLDGHLLSTSSMVGQTFKVRYQLDLCQQLLTAWAVSDDNYKTAVATQSQAQTQSQWSERPTKHVPPGRPL